jgi:DNA modification methylase
VTTLFPNSNERFFHAFPHDEQGAYYHPKASKADRAGSKHPTVKPVALMQYLIRHITPPGGTVLDPFAGSGTTGEAARREGFAARLWSVNPNTSNSCTSASNDQ